MKIRGGQANFNGVTFFDENYAAKAILIDGQIRIIQERIPQNRVLARMREIPFLRGVGLLFEVNLKLVLVLLVLDLIPWGNLFPSVFGPEVFPDWTLYVLFALVLLVLRFRFPRVWQYHGAEHKVVNAQQKKKELTLESVKQESRITEDCGTNLVAFILPLYFVLVYALSLHDVLTFFISLSVGYELFRLDQKKYRFLVPFYNLGGLFQKYVVTIEPTDRQIEVALQAYSGLNQQKANEAQ